MLHGFMKSRVEKHVQEDKKNKRWTELNGSEPHGFSACQAQKGLWIVLNGEVSI